MIPYVTEPTLSLRAFTRADLRIVEPWFRDPDTRRFLGGPEWPRRMLELGEGVVGQEFRGAIQTGAYRYLAHADRGLVGYVDCGTFNRCTVYAGEGPEGPIVTESIEDETGSIAFVIDPQIRRRGVGRAMISALIHQPELGFVELFEAGVEPGNMASRRCLEAAGFRLGSEKPDFEGMLYYRARRPDLNPGATLSA
jgi:RimJ/RimL family protein N-acetyltransferase